MKNFLLLLSLILSLTSLHAQQKKQKLSGAWQCTEGDTRIVLVFADQYFTKTKYDKNNGEFISTAGGTWILENERKLTKQFEFNTADTSLVGQSTEIQVKWKGKLISTGNKESQKEWNRIDEGKPGELYGAYFFTGRMRDGEINEYTPGARRTLKILSGTRFQWIAYNLETKQFFGTGGGTYTTSGGIYTENIEFFSRDNERVGASLTFNYDLKDGKWHHSGKNSRGEDLYELWTRSTDLDL